ncbi:L,D-transpeptidase [uncultured Roseovarius sp.]|uniref:L,D-transpeptidase n=1 Tax=uncultured Roseovarius sp. TaxID=293344 RepID=UPI00263A365A|nr:L,D-transpeptidase [uncultured Roseovarius sp.]
MLLKRRDFLAGASACLLSTPALALRGPHLDIDYLEGLTDNPALNRAHAYIPPSRIHEAYSHVVYVDAAFRGEGRQKMWVLARKGAGWDLAVRDPGYWDAITPTDAAYSWPVSTGRAYPGDRRSGPTIPGVFNIDERPARHRRGWGSPGMYKAIYYDLHYSSGRASGIAFHGTTRSLYRKLGTPDSHGCVRMRQANMDRFWGLIHPGGATGEQSPLWGEVPRYFASTPKSSFTARRGYVRDGTLLKDSAGNLRTKMGYTVLVNVFLTDAA